MKIERIKVNQLVEFLALKTDVSFTDTTYQKNILNGNLLRLYNDKKLDIINDYYINNIIPTGEYKLIISIENGGESDDN